VFVLGVVLLFVFLFLSSCLGQTAQCTSDLMSATTSLINIGSRIANATVDCNSQSLNTTKCLKDISTITTEFGRVSDYITQAVGDCGNMRSDCIEAVAAIVPTILDSTQLLTKAGIDCSQRKKQDCQDDIIKVGLGVAKVVNFIIKAVQVCTGA